MDIFFEILKTVGIIGIIAVTWRIATQLATLQTSVTMLIDNHIPHLEEEIKNLRQSFIIHLERRAK